MVQWSSIYLRVIWHGFESRRGIVKKILCNIKIFVGSVLPSGQGTHNCALCGEILHRFKSDPPNHMVMSYNRRKSSRLLCACHIQEPGMQVRVLPWPFGWNSVVYTRADGSKRGETRWVVAGSTPAHPLGVAESPIKLHYESTRSGFELDVKYAFHLVPYQALNGNDSLVG